MAYLMPDTDEFRVSGDPFDRSEALGAAIAMVSGEGRAAKASRRNHAPAAGRAGRGERTPSLVEALKAAILPKSWLKT